MPLNEDLLIKLAKLANNNPNENEANAAARKVCKLLEENGYKINNKSEGWNGLNITYYGVSENFRRPTGQPYNPYTRTGFDPFHNRIRISCSKCGNPTWVSLDNYDDKKPTLCEKCFFKESTKPKPDQKKCSKCGKMKQTAYVGPEFLFVCQECEWR